MAGLGITAQRRYLGNREVARFQESFRIIDAFFYQIFLRRYGKGTQKQPSEIHLTDSAERGEIRNAQIIVGEASVYFVNGGVNDLKLCFRKILLVINCYIRKVKK